MVTKLFTLDATPGSSRKRKGQDDEETSEELDTPPKRRKIGRNDGTGEVCCCLLKEFVFKFRIPLPV